MIIETEHVITHLDLGLKFTGYLETRDRCTVFGGKMERQK